MVVDTRITDGGKAASYIVYVEPITKNSVTTLEPLSSFLSKDTFGHYRR